MARYGAALHADLLKVGHHGSRTSTGGAPRGCRPSIAAVSWGVLQPLQAPEPEVLSAARPAGSRSTRTDRGGALTGETDGERPLVPPGRAAPGPRAASGAAAGHALENGGP